MTQRVPGVPPRLMEEDDERSQIRAALPVQGYGQWHAMAGADNWLHGVGGTIATLGPGYSSISASNTATFHAYAWPRAQHGTWLWAVELVASAGGANGTVTLTPGSDVFEWSVASTKPETVFFTHDPSSIADGGISIAVHVDTNSAGSVTVQTIGVYELPRAFLPTTASSVGVHETSCIADQPIHENTSTADKFSIQAVWEQVRDASTLCRRQKMFDWFNPGGVTATVSTFSGTSNVFHVDPAIQNRLLGTLTARDASFTTYALVTGGGAIGEVRVTMASGATATITVTNTTAAWATPTTFAIDTDELSETGWVRDGVRDTATFEIRKTAGTSITVYGISVGEDS
jgi:hypothetical protein